MTKKIMILIWLQALIVCKMFMKGASTQELLKEWEI